MDRYHLYELCAQSPGDLAALLAAIHGGRPLVLGEDFCGTAALSRHWVGRIAGGRAVAVDHDPEPLARARAGVAGGVEIVHGDVVADTAGRGADVIHAGNFSIGEWHERAALLAYLRHARSRLAAGGVFVCDVYGGESAFLTGEITREHPGPGGRTVRYTWEQRRADPMTGRVVDAMHFEVLRGDGTVEQTLRDAFVYHWRLWGVPELRDAMIEAGFARTEVYRKVPDAADGEGEVYAAPISDPAELDESFDVLIAARSSPRTGSGGGS